MTCRIDDALELPRPALHPARERAPRGRRPARAGRQHLPPDRQGARPRPALEVAARAAAPRRPARQLRRPLGGRLGRGLPRRRAFAEPLRRPAAVHGRALDADRRPTRSSRQARPRSSSRSRSSRRSRLRAGCGDCESSAARPSSRSRIASSTRGTSRSTSTGASIPCRPSRLRTASTCPPGTGWSTRTAAACWARQGDSYEWPALGSLDVRRALGPDAACFALHYLTELEDGWVAATDTAASAGSACASIASCSRWSGCGSSTGAGATTTTPSPSPGRATRARWPTPWRPAVRAS